MITELSKVDLFWEMLDKFPTHVAMKHYPKFLEDDQAFALKAISVEYRAYQYLPRELKMNKLFTKEAVVMNRNIFTYIPTELEEDEDFLKDLLFAIALVDEIAQLRYHVTNLKEQLVGANSDPALEELDKLMQSDEE